MPANKAVACRILELCKARNISVNSLAAIARVPWTTLYSIINEKSQSSGIVTIEQLCRALGIDLHTFFDSALFADDIS